MEPEGSLPCSQPTTGTYLEPDASSPQLHTTPNVPKIYPNIIFHLRLSLLSGLFPSVFQPKHCTHFSSLYSCCVSRQ